MYFSVLNGLGIRNQKYYPALTPRDFPLEAQE